jgi:hypothetical protein
MLDEDYGDITDPLEGRDVKVTCTKAPGRMWATTTVRPRGKATPLNTDATTVKEWTTNIPSLDDLYTLKSYDELEKVVNDWLNGVDESEDSPSGTSRPSGANVSTTETDLTVESSSDATTSSNYKSLDEAFADLEDL